MSDLLWQKPGVEVDAQIQAFLAGDDVILDREFFLHDVAASRAHAEGLQRIGILGDDELAAIGRELDALATAWFGVLTPWTLLGFTFLIGCGTALNNPSWQASVGDIVTRDELPAAVALNSVGFNLTRSVGPAIGGMIVAAAVLVVAPHRAEVLIRARIAAALTSTGTPVST